MGNTTFPVGRVCTRMNKILKRTLPTLWSVIQWREKCVFVCVSYLHANESAVFFPFGFCIILPSFYFVFSILSTVFVEHMLQTHRILQITKLCSFKVSRILSSDGLFIWFVIILAKGKKTSLDVLSSTYKQCNQENGRVHWAELWGPFCLKSVILNCDRKRSRGIKV